VSLHFRESLAAALERAVAWLTLLSRHQTDRPIRHRRLTGVAVHAVALRALLTDAPSVLSPAEQQLLNDWLHRLATARSHGDYTWIMLPTPRT